MVTATFRRYRMARALEPLPCHPLPPGFLWVPWQPDLLEVHADTLYRSFAGELDSLVFPSLGSLEGCRRIMHDITNRPGFLPETTWLVVTADRQEPCGTIQGIRVRDRLGAIQNLGVVAAYRRRGLAKALLVQAMHGFRTAGVERVYLEVTAENLPAIRLYEQLGFGVEKVMQTIRRTLDVEPDG